MIDRLERVTKQPRRLVERELRRGFLGGRLQISRRALGVAGAEQVRGQRFEIGIRGRFQRGSQPTVVFPHVGRREQPDDGLADAVVRHLDDLAPVAHPRAREPSVAEEGDGLARALADAGRGHGQRHRQRPSADGHDLDEADGFLGKPRKAVTDHLIERHEDEARLVCSDPSAVASHELLDEKRAAPGLPRHRARDPLRHLVGRVEQRERQGERVVDIEGSNGDVADLRPLRPPLADLHQQRALDRPPPSRYVIEQEQRRCFGRTEDLDEERGAVEIAPLRVVDEAGRAA